ncbi:MAG: response regulator, partial [Candidatus Eremiobacterota bacterium]
MNESVRILLLEDDANMRQMLTLVLTREDYQVEAAANGMEAVALASKQPFDLVVADIRMEGIDGLEALARVREQQPQVRSLVVTGYSTEADSIRAIRLGVGDYLKKPFDLKEFLGSVRRLVGARRQELARAEHEQRLRNSLLRTTEALARLLDTVGHPGRPQRGLLEAGRLGLRLAQTAELHASSAQDVQLAVLLGAIGSLEGDPYEPASEELPASLALALRHLDERWDGQGGPDGLSGEQIPLESRLAAMALAVAREEGPPFPEGRLDPRCVDLLGHLQRAGPSAGTEGQALRGLLSLGRALEEAGDQGGASHAFREIVLTRRPVRELVEAHLGLARLALKGGFEPEAARHARLASEAAAPLGLWLSAQTQLKAGMLLSRLGDPAGTPMLEQACRLFRDLRDRGGEALALLGARVLGGAQVHPQALSSALEALLAPEHAWDLAGTAGWLLPFLLEQPPAPLLERALVQLARDVPREYEGVLAGLSVAARRAAAAALGLAGGPVAERLLVELASDAAPEVRAEVDAGRRRQLAHRSPPVLRIFTLGPLEVFRGEDRIPDKAWRSQKCRYVLAYLAAAKAQPVSEDLLIDAFWADDFDKGRRNLYWCSSMLRSLLRPDGWPDDLDYIHRSGGCLQLNPEVPRWHDMEELEKHYEEGMRQRQAGQTSPAVESFRKAVALYRAPFLEACYMDWTDPIRQRLADRVSESLSFLHQQAGQEGRHHESLDYAQRLLALDPCRQEAYEGALAALLALGRPEEAVRLFESCRRTLQQELGMEPTLKLLEFYE